MRAGHHQIDHLADVGQVLDVLALQLDFLGSAIRARRDAESTPSLMKMLETLKLDGTETFDITGLTSLRPRQKVKMTIHRANGQTQDVPVTLRIDTPIEVEYYQNGGILPFVLRQLIAAGGLPVAA